MGANHSTASWRQSLLRDFTPDVAAVARLTVVWDPDGLLSDQGMLAELRGNGFDLAVREDPVAFRFEYESKYRDSHRQGGARSLVVVVRDEGAGPETLPYDLLAEARHLQRTSSLSVASLFQNLDPKVVAALEHQHWDALYQAEQDHRHDRLGENATKDFVLRHVFDLDVERLKSDADMLHFLLHRHYGTVGFPGFLDQRLVQLLRQQSRWSEWPLEVLVPDRNSFFGFLEERWPLFLRKKMGQAKAAAVGDTHLRFTGPADLPFENDRIRVYVDNLFVEGLMAPTHLATTDALPESWMAAGVVTDRGEDEVCRLKSLLSIIRDSIPARNAPHLAWTQVAQRWAEATQLRWSIPGGAADAIQTEFDQVQAIIDEAFAAWIGQHYASLSSLGFVPRPVMLHHVPHRMAHGSVGPGPLTTSSKKALILVDGLAMSQWPALRRSLDPDMVVEESAVFAWIPTLTCVSRQALFAGEAPFHFGGTIETTQKDESHWLRFWENHGARKGEASFLGQKAMEPDEAFVARVEEEAGHPRRRILGLVVGTVDRMVHGAATGARGLHASVKDWADAGHLNRLVSTLLDQNFEVYLTSDHGNIEATGVGKPNVGAVADERGERVHVFRDPLTRASTAHKFPGSIEWPSTGLPDGYCPLLSPGRSAFIGEAQRTVAHGGASLEEVMVPFAIIRRRA